MDRPTAAGGVLLCDDLIFTSRVAGAARAAGVEVRPARTADALIDLARRHRPGWAILDLGLPGLALTDVLARLREAAGPAIRVAAYGAHVDVEGLKAARAAGCEPVLPRSKFVEALPELLQTLASGGRPPLDESELSGG